METNQQNTDAVNNELSDYLNDVKQIELEGYQMRVRKARNALFWAGGLLFFWEMFSLLRSGEGFDSLVFGFAVLIAGIFVALALLTKKKPYTAIIIGIIVFIGHWLLAIVSHTMLTGGEGLVKALLGGVIVRVIIIVNLIRPLQDAKELQQSLNEKTLQ